MSNNLEKIDRLAKSFQIATIRDQDDSINIRYGVLGPKDADRFLVFLNGRTEWIEKYAYLAEDFQLAPKTGFVTLDHRGQGASGGARAYVDTYDTYAADLKAALDVATGGKPYTLVTHSMGGLIGLYATVSGAVKPERLILSSPLLGLPDKPVPKPIAKPLSKLLNGIGFGNVSSGGGNFSKTRFENNQLTHDVDLFERIQETPYKVPGATFGWVAATFDAIDRVFSDNAIGNFNTPTLVMAGSEETVVDPDAIRNWVQIVSEKHPHLEVSYRVIAGAKHELFSEIPKYYDQALTHVREFLKNW